MVKLEQVIGNGPTASRPSAPATGQLYFDTDLQQEMRWTGSAWVAHERSLGTTATTAAAGNHTHTGYESSLGNPAADGYHLASTAAGARSWVAPSTGAPSGAAGGDLAGTYPSPTLANTTAARANLGLGSIATHAASEYEPALGNPDTDGKLLASTAAGARSWVAQASGGSAHTIADEGTPLTSRPTLDFVGAGVTVTDDAVNAKTVVTVPGYASLAFVIDGGGAAITTGVKGDVVVPFDCTVLQATLLADQSGSIAVDVWRTPYASYDAGATHPVAADKITASAPPTISSATKSQDATLTGWTTSLSAGDVLRFNVNSVSSIQRATLALRLSKR